LTTAKVLLIVIPYLYNHLPEIVAGVLAVPGAAFPTEDGVNNKPHGFVTKVPSLRTLEMLYPLLLVPFVTLLTGELQ
jgi:hypothetical protein